MSSVSRDNIVDEIKSRCNIVDVVGRVVSLKRAGGNYKGLCPFHNEKTPSFVVSDTKQIFSCFGCNASGDVIGFVQRYYSLDFPAAIEKLAGEYGIDIKGAYAGQGSANKEELYEINRKAARFFYTAFSVQGNPALLYMQKRGIEPGILKRFGIGYADSEWDSLFKHFKEIGTDVKLLVSLGLVTESKGKYYDKFRSRVIFPIINSGGKVIGFGGRSLGDDGPKYLNSPESAVFLKKNNLFGLNLTRQDISRENRAILVEGYMDVISLYMHGVRNVSASLGTALTENQARLLKRYTANVTLSYDADEAGQAAALRGVDILYKEGLKAKVIGIPSGKDPDDYVKQNGRQAFLNLADKALPYADYRLDIIRKKYDLTETEGKVDFIKEAVAFLRTLSPVEAETYIKLIAKDTKISESAITLEFNGNSGDSLKSQNRGTFRDAGEGTAAGGDAPDILEKNLLRLIISSKGYLDRIKPFENVFTSRYGREIFNAVETGYGGAGELDINSMADSLDSGGVKALRDILDNVFFAGKEEQVFTDCVKKIEFNDLTRKEKEIVLKLSMADESENAAQITALTGELLDVQKKIQGKKAWEGR